MGDNWELPKPVFRSTSGSLPQDFVGRVGSEARPQAEAKAPNADDQILSSLYAPPDETVEEPVVHEPPPTLPSVDIEPQPVISEQFSVDEIDTIAPDKPVKKKKRLGSAMLLVALVFLLAVLGTILGLIYVLFFRNPAQNTF